MEAMSRAFGMPMPSLGMPASLGGWLDEALPAAAPSALPAMAKSLAVDIKVRWAVLQMGTVVHEGCLQAAWVHWLGRLPAAASARRPWQPTPPHPGALSVATLPHTAPPASAPPCRTAGPRSASTPTCRAWARTTSRCR